MKPLHWAEEEGMDPIHVDAWGGRIFLVEFGDTVEEEEGDLIMSAECAEALSGEDHDQEEEAAIAEEVKAAKSAKLAYLVVHPSGDEVWTRTRSYAFDLLNRNAKGNRPPDLFAA